MQRERGFYPGLRLRLARGYPCWTPYGVGPECTKPRRVQYKFQRNKNRQGFRIRRTGIFFEETELKHIR
jgi:hypothetical protein